MTSVSRGRPQASSREMLADAACELFLEQGYDSTTVVDITQRAGVSRSTFFNYFDGKAATIWFALDEHLARVTGSLVDHGAPIHTALHAFVTDLGDAPPHTLALAITNADVMGITDELAVERAVRQSALAATFAGAIRGQRGATALRADIEGAAYSAAVFSAIWAWAGSGAGAARLDAMVSGALAELQRGQAQRRVAVIGAGAIGSRVVEELVAGKVPGATLAGVVTRRPGTVSGDIVDFGDDLERAIAESDLVVDCAGIPALKALGPRIIASGRELLTISIGALADPETRAVLNAGPGRLRLSSGAIGGLDVIAAAARPNGVEGGITSASITTRKRAGALVQSWMSEEEIERLRTTTEEFELFSGTVAQAIAKFPSSLNVACAVANAAGLWEETRVTLIADPHAGRTKHEINAAGNVGTYKINIENAVSPMNPTSSLIVAEAVLADIAGLV